MAHAALPSCRKILAPFVRCRPRSASLAPLEESSGPGCISPLASEEVTRWLNENPRSLLTTCLRPPRPSLRCVSSISDSTNRGTGGGCVAQHPEVDLVAGVEAGGPVSCDRRPGAVVRLD